MPRVSKKPVDFNPFEEAPRRARVSDTPVDYDPFAEPARGVGAADAFAPRVTTPAAPAVAPVGELIRGNLRSGTGQALGGTQQFVGESATKLMQLVNPMNLVLPEGVDPEIDAARAAADAVMVGNAPNFARTGELVAQEARAEGKRTMRGIERPESLADAFSRPGNAARFYGGQVAQMLPPMLAAAATRNPQLAATVMGGAALGPAFSEAREGGAGFTGAAASGLVAAALESILGKATFEQAFLPGMSFGKRAARTAATEAATEVPTTVGQMAAEEAFTGKDYTAEQMRAAAIDSAILGPLVSGPVSVVGHMTDVARAQAEEEAQAAALSEVARMRAAEAFAGAQTAPVAPGYVADAAPLTVNPATGAPVGPVVKPRAAPVAPGPSTGPALPPGVVVDPRGVEPNVPRAAAPAPAPPPVADVAQVIAAVTGLPPEAAAEVAASPEISQLVAAFTGQAPMAPTAQEPAGAPIAPPPAAPVLPEAAAAAPPAPVQPQAPMAAQSPVLQRLAETDEQRMERIKATPPNQRTDADLSWANDRQRADAKSKAEAVARQEAEAKAASEDTDGFADEQSPMRRAKTIAALNSSVQRDGKVTTVKALVRDLVAQGHRVTTRKDGSRVLMAPDGSWLEQKRVTKTGLDYAEHLAQNPPVTAPAGRGNVEPAAVAPEAPQGQGAGTPPTAAPTPPERLTELRARGEQRTPEEAAEYTALLEEDRLAGRVAGSGLRMPGVRNMTAHADDRAAGLLKPTQAFVDGDNFKRINDEIGHDAGDDAIAQMGAALAAEFPGDVFHRGGDEFFVQGADEATVAAGVDRARERLKGAVLSVTAPDGTVVSRTGIGLSYGTGATTQEAENASKSDKAARAAAGLRTERTRASDDGAGDAGASGPADAGAAQGGEGDADAPAAPAAPEVAPPVTPPKPRVRLKAVPTEAAPAAVPAPPTEDATPPPDGEEPRPAAAPSKPADDTRTSTKNATTEAERAAEDKPPRDAVEPLDNETVIERARQSLKEDPARGEEVVQRVLNGGKLSLEDVAILQIHKAKLRNDRRAAAKRVTDPKASPEAKAAARAEYEEIEAKLNALNDAADRSGTETARMLQLRSRMINEDYSLAAVEDQWRIRHEREPTPEEQAAIEARYREAIAKIAELQKRVDETEARLRAAADPAELVESMVDALKPKKNRPLLDRLRGAAEASRKALAASRGQFRSGVDPTDFLHMARIGAYHVANGAAQFSDWLARMKADVGQKIVSDFGDTIREVYRAAKIAAAPMQNDSDAKYQEAQSKRIARAIEAIREKIANRQFGRPGPRSRRVLNKENAEAMYELKLARAEFDRLRLEDDLKNRSTLSKIYGFGKEALSFSRSLVTSLDLPPILRQGSFSLASHPIISVKALVKTLRKMWTDRSHFDLDRELAARANARNGNYDRMGLALSEATSYDAKRQEEVFASRWLAWTKPEGSKLKRAAIIAKDIATYPLRLSARSYSGFLNLVRADVADALIASYNPDGKTLSTRQLRLIGSFVNVTTGRGDLGKAEAIADELNVGLFAARWTWSRFQVLTMFPLRRALRADPETGRRDAKMARLFAGQYARAIAGYTTMLALAAMVSDPTDDDDYIELDPRSPNFGKIRVGKVFLDPMGGLSQPAALMARLWTQSTVDAQGGEREFKSNFRESAMTTAQFIRSKLSLAVGGAINLAAGEDLVGMPVTPTSAALDMVLPLSWRDAPAAVEEAGIPKGLAAWGVSLFGAGLSVRSAAREAIRAAWKKEKARQERVDAGGRPAVSAELSEKPKGEWASALEAMKRDDPSLADVELDVYNDNADNRKRGRVGQPIVTKGGFPKLTGKVEEGGAAKDDPSGSLPGEESTPSGEAMPLDGVENPPKVVTLPRNGAGIPDSVLRFFEDTGAEGAFDSPSKTVYVAPELKGAKRSFVVHHEVAGHYGLQGSLGEEYSETMTRARRNPVVADLADAMDKTYSSYEAEEVNGLDWRKIRMTEEALSELAAAQRTGDYDYVEQKWGVEIPRSMRNGMIATVSRVIRETKDRLAEASGKPASSYSDTQVRGLIEGAWRYVRDPKPRDYDPPDATP